MKRTQKKFLTGYLQKQNDNDSRSFEVIASTDALDREGERIDQGGWELDNYMKNPVILWAHNIDTPPIGKATSVKVKGDSLIIEGEFASAEANPLAEQIRILFKEGIQQAVSVGFIPLEREGETITRAELLELSFVPVPANPEAIAVQKRFNLDKRLVIVSPLVEKENDIINYDPTNFRNKLMKIKVNDDAPEEEMSGLEKELDEVKVELKEIAVEILEEKLPDIEEAVGKQLEDEPVIEELVKEIEEIIDKNIDAMEEAVVEDVGEVVEANGGVDSDKQDDGLIEEAEAEVEKSIDDTVADIAVEIGTAIEQKAEEILSAVEEEKQGDAEEALAPVIKELESEIMKELEEALIEAKEVIAEEAIEEVGTGDPQEKPEEDEEEDKKRKNICDPESDDYDPEACADMTKGGHIEEICDPTSPLYDPEACSEKNKAGHDDDDEEEEEKKR